MAKAHTQAAVEKRKPHPLRRSEVPDGVVPGLYLVVQPSGAKSWALRYRLHGRPQKHTLGKLAAFDVKGARELARDALAVIAKGRDPGAERKQARHEAADKRNEFQFVAEQFVERYAKPKNKSWQQSTWTLGLKPGPEGLVKTESGVVAKWAGRRIQDITRRDVIELLDGIVDRGSPVMANRTLAAIRRLFNWCKERDILTVSPCENVKAPGPEKTRSRALDDWELKLLWKAADAEDSWQFGALVKLLILTGQRRSEVGEMRRGEIDVNQKTWTIPSERAKNKKVHEVPLSTAAMAVIEKLPNIKGDLVFTTTGKTPVSGFTRAKDRLSSAVAKAAAPKDVEDWTIHDLRRTAASGMARLAQPVHVVEAVLNHKSGTIRGVAAIYNRYSYADEKRAALEAWGRHVTALIQGATDNVVELSTARK